METEREKEYKLCLMHVVKFIREPEYGSPLQPLNASYANGIAEMCVGVLNGDTTEEAIKNLSPQND